MQSSNSVKKSVFVCKPLVVLYNIMLIYDLKKHSSIEKAYYWLSKTVLQITIHLDFLPLFSSTLFYLFPC